MKTPILSLILLAFLPAVAFAADPPDPYSAPTVDRFLATCSTNPGGCQGAVGIVLMERVHFDGSSGICLNAADYASKVPAWLQSHAETHTMKTADGIYLALQKMYPCD